MCAGGLWRIIADALREVAAQSRPGKGPIMKKDPRPNRKAPGRRRKMGLAVSLVLVLLVFLLGVALLRGRGSDDRQPPAPDAPKAVAWSPEKESPAENKASQIIYETEPGPQIVLEVLEVPERLLGPSPPIEGNPIEGNS